MRVISPPIPFLFIFSVFSFLSFLFLFSSFFSLFFFSFYYLKKSTIHLDYQQTLSENRPLESPSTSTNIQFSLFLTAHSDTYQTQHKKRWCFPSKVNLIDRDFMALRNKWVFQKGHLSIGLIHFSRQPGSPSENHSLRLGKNEGLDLPKRKQINLRG